MDVIEYKQIDSQVAVNDNIKEIINLSERLLNIYKTEFITIPKLITSSMLSSILGLQELLELVLIINKKLMVPEYNQQLQRLYQQFWQDYKKSQQLYWSLKQSWSKLLDIAEIIAPAKRKILDYVFNNLIDYLEQQNLLCLNQELLSANLLAGIKNFLADLVINKGYFNIPNNDLTAFKPGINIAITPGKVVYKNYLIELIQYTPVTATVYKAPILIIPPCINKYYILDLSSNNSLVKWLVDQGFVVYMISWSNPNPDNYKYADTQFADYVIDGGLAAIRVINNIVQHKQIHTVGYCIGGTILGCLVSYIQQTHNNKNTANIEILSATNFMSLLDFADMGDISMFFKQTYLDFLENTVNNKGYLDGRILSMAFNALRPNDLIWPYLINNYLLNKPLKAFDILYWNSDPTNLPANMYKFYLNKICYHNLLSKANGIKINNISIDLSKINVPVFAVAGEKDHITPWQSVYASCKLYSGSTQFVLAAAGHVKGLINPPEDNKYSYKINIINKKLPKNFNIWLKNTVEHSGSWWPYWKNWLININNKKISAKIFDKLNTTKLKDAPGSYVLERL